MVRFSKWQMMVSNSSFICKIIKGFLLQYLLNYLNTSFTSNYQSRAANRNNAKEFSCNIYSSLHFSFHLCVWEWININNFLRIAKPRKWFKLFSTKVLTQKIEFIVFDTWSNIFQPKFILLSEHFVKDCASPMYDCDIYIEITVYHSLHCQFFSNERQKLYDSFIC